MKLRQRGYPYIYGYKTLIAGVLRDLKVSILPARQDVLNRVLSFDLENTNYSSKLSLKEKAKIDEHFASARTIKQREIVYALYYLLADWQAPIAGAITTTLFTQRVIAYLQGREDAAWKLKQALNEYKGFLIDEIPGLISAINADKLTEDQVSGPRRTEILRDAGLDFDELTHNVRFRVAAAVAAIYIRTRLSDEEKYNKAEKAVNRIFNSHDLIRDTATGLSAIQLSRGLSDYFLYQSIPYHTWIIDAPIDTPCIIPNGETVRVGTPFSNGYIWAGRVHDSCHCTTRPARINDDYVRLLIRKYGR